MIERTTSRQANPIVIINMTTPTDAISQSVHCFFAESMQPNVGQNSILHEEEIDTKSDISSTRLVNPYFPSVQSLTHSAHLPTPSHTRTVSLN